MAVNGNNPLNEAQSRPPLTAVISFFRRNLLQILICSITLSLILIGIIHWALCLSDKKNAENFSKILLEQSVNIAKSVSATIKEANAAVNDDISLVYPDDKCSDSVQTRLRTILYKSEYIVDLGIMGSGHVICTVTAGNFQTPIQLHSTTQKNINGYYYIWSNITDPIDPNISYNAFGFNGIIAFLSKSTFSFLGESDNTYSADLVTKDGSFRYRPLTLNTRPETRLSAVIPDITELSCDDTRDICVRVTNNHPGLLSFSLRSC